LRQLRGAEVHPQRIGCGAPWGLPCDDEDATFSLVCGVSELVSPKVLRAQRHDNDFHIRFASSPRFSLLSTYSCAPGKREIPAAVSRHARRGHLSTAAFSFRLSVFPPRLFSNRTDGLYRISAVAGNRDASEKIAGQPEAGQGLSALARLEISGLLGPGTPNRCSE